MKSIVSIHVLFLKKKMKHSSLISFEDMCFSNNVSSHVGKFVIVLELWQTIFYY